MSRLSNNEIIWMNTGLEEFGVNTLVSDKISVHRILEDKRHPKCKLESSNVNHLPSVSIIITFYNEPWSTLVRTVWSILHSTPDVLLGEILLVDDCSDKENLGAKFGNFVATIPRTRLVRNSVRQGLIRSRNIGAAMATGEALLFLDAHCELNVGWLEPLLPRDGKFSQCYLSHEGANLKRILQPYFSLTLCSIRSPLPCPLWLRFTGTLSNFRTTPMNQYTTTGYIISAYQTGRKTKKPCRFRIGS